MDKCRCRILLLSFSSILFGIIRRFTGVVWVEHFLQQKDIPFEFFMYRNVLLPVQGCLSCVTLDKAFVS